MPKLDMAQTNSIADKNTTMTSIIRLAIIVLMARRDLRFRLIPFFAHFTMLIFSFALFYCLSGLTDRGFQKPGSSDWASRCAISSPSPDYVEGELIVSRGDHDDSV